MNRKTTKKYPILIALVLILILASCNLPQKQAVPSEEDVATAVAQTLTAEPVLPLATDQPLSPSPTPAPDEPTITPTEQVPPTETPTPTITPTNIPDDPASALGAPAWERDMVNGTAFGIGPEGYEDENTRIYMGSGVMVLESASTLGYRGWRLTSPTPQNMYLQATFNTPSCSGKDLYGLVFRAKDYSSGQGYYFGITCSGQYNFSRWDENGTTTLIDSKPGEEILSGAGKTNRIGVLADGNNLKLYANGKLLEEVQDSGLPNGGHIGVFLAGSSGNLKAELDHMAYWNLR